jgi:hypothetical protein
MVTSAVAMVEGASVLPVEIAHAVREAGRRRLENEVVVVAEEAVGVNSPAVTELHPPKDVEEDGAVLLIECDRRSVVAAGSDVVVRTGGEVAERASHCSDASLGRRRLSARLQFRRASDAVMSRARRRTGPNPPPRPMRREGSAAG